MWLYFSLAHDVITFCPQGRVPCTTVLWMSQKVRNAASCPFPGAANISCRTIFEGVSVVSTSVSQSQGICMRPYVQTEKKNNYQR